MKLKSFGMLLPCGVGIFGGVEFVCCPAWSTTTSPPELVTLGTEKKQLENQITYKDAEDNGKYIDSIDNNLDRKLDISDRLSIVESKVHE
ncbi:amyloid beta precursor like protein 2-like isoform X1 [Panonychus citri]|uniref:amyloid beta precursor like protein 2-like isoform X1 n=1 Tax=Panonychus citri TaxID=50023 RepID=UPI0023075F2C|nr:amyloid beta precursor like protein 2-like isoform X1 [Panonychus citri]